jgi:hypothetical protein
MILRAAPSPSVFPPRWMMRAMGIDSAANPTGFGSFKIAVLAMSRLKL